jgi:molybdate-binding protein/DNA-binding transcriptional regulator YhcF (GntR family)
MEELHLYQQIIAAVRQDILVGRLNSGDRLPSVREMAERWDCTLGTAQRAYSELAHQGLVVSRVGQGTHVVEKPPLRDVHDDTPLRRAALVQRAGAFLLETLTAGYTPEEVEAALRLALDQYRTIVQNPEAPTQGALRFAGSHDMALVWLAAHFREIVPHFTLQLGFNGSLGGLIALQQGRADLAGCHLWDEETDTYNLPFVRRLLPGRRVALVTLAQRRLGLIVPRGNPAGIIHLVDLLRPEVRFANRQAGSGTRVWLDAAFHKIEISPTAIHGYEDEYLTHTDVARRVAEDKANAALGLETAALAYGLDFVFLVLERYDLAIPVETMEMTSVQRLVEWLLTGEARQAIDELGGYNTAETGRLEWA